MVRVEHLRAKSINAEVAYLNDLKRLGEIKRTEEKQHTALRKKQSEFWSETVRAHSHSMPGSTPPHNPSTKLPSQLERMWRAHSQLQHATIEHAATSQTLQANINSVVASKRKIDLLSQLVAKATRARASRIESRIADDLTDLAASSRKHALNDSTPSQPTPQKRFNSGPQVEEPALRDVPQTSRLRQELVPSVPVTSPVIPSNPAPRVAQPPVSAVSLSSLRINEISTHSGDGGTTLSFSCTLGRVGQVGLAVERKANGTVAVRVEPANAGIVTSLLRERGQIQGRLQSLGIRLDSLEIASSKDGNYSPGRGLRRAPRGDDEDIIT